MRIQNPHQKTEKKRVAGVTGDISSYHWVQVSPPSTIGKKSLWCSRSTFLDSLNDARAGVLQHFVMLCLRPLEYVCDSPFWYGF